MTDFSDYELIKLIREQDDKQAFQLLYNRYWSKLFNLALLKIHNQDEVSDIIQNLFVAIWIKRKELNINNNVDLYLYRSLKNRIINFYKRKYLTDDKIDQLSKTMSGKTESEAENICAYKEIELVINREIASMPNKMKQVYLLSREERLSSKNIADMLSLSDQTVRNQISKAIKRIKLTLEKYNVVNN